MSEDIQAVAVEPQVSTPEAESNTDTQVSSIEQQALSQGWRPKEEFEGDPEKWRPAKEFLDRGELFGKIDSVSRELKDTRKALKMLQEHNAKLRETEFKHAVDELKAKQKEHLEAGDSDQYLATTELLTDLKAEQKAREVVSEQVQQAPDPRFTNWVDKNKWYSQNQEMREFADTVGLRHATANPGKDPEQILEYVEAQVKRAYSEKFQNPQRNRPSAVEGSPSPAASKKADFKLTDEETRVMNTFVRQNVLTKDEYIEQVKRMRGAV